MLRDPDDQATAVVRTWFERAWTQLGGPLRDELALHPLAVDDIRAHLLAGRIFDTFPAVGMPWCDLIRFGGAYSDEVVAANTLNPRSWTVFVRALESFIDGPVYLRGGFIESGERFPRGSGPGFPDLNIRASLDGPTVEQVRLGISCDPKFLLSTPEREDAVCEFFYGVASSANPAYGEIALHLGDEPPGRSLLESALQTLDIDAKRDNWRMHPRDQLKGYSWVTIMPGELVHRLGGLIKLQSSGAFYEVTALPGGGAWLKATARLANYDQAAARRVFEVVRPVLIRGEPRLAAAGTSLAPEAA